MINLTTFCRKSETVCYALIALAAVISIIFSVQERPLSSAQEPNDSVSVLQLNEPTVATSEPAVAASQPVVGGFIKGEVQTSFVEPSQGEQIDAPVPKQDFEPQVLIRGPLHEAFAQAHQADPQPNVTISATPPKPINELPPQYKPDGENVQWIPGYWSWDEAQSDFIWISGVWRDIPPNQTWFAGYWEQVDSGFRWISGYWTNEANQPLTYLPTPPVSFDSGPSIAAPGENFFYCPGNWEYQANQFAWRAGHWQPRVENWVWIPARYVWTPRGCIYRTGYWDYELDHRGTAFAPVYFSNHAYEDVAFQYRPSYSINTGADFFVHLFVRPNCNQYFFGDWYDSNRTVQYQPWINVNSHHGHYDPLLVHYNNNRYRHLDVSLLSWVNQQHDHYANHREDRPKRSLDAQLKFTKSKHDDPQVDFLRRATLAKNEIDQRQDQRQDHVRKHPKERSQPDDVVANTENRKRTRGDDQKDDRLAIDQRQLQALAVQADLNRKTLERAQKQQLRESEIQAKLGSQRDIAANLKREQLAREDREKSKRRDQIQTTEQQRLEDQREQTERNRKEFARGQERQRRLEDLQNSNLTQSQREDANAARRQRYEVDRARDMQDRANQLQLTTEQIRLENQRDQIQRNREEFMRNQNRKDRQSDGQEKLARDKAQRDAQSRESNRQMELDRQNRDAQQRANQERDRMAAQQKMEQSQQAAIRQQQEKSARDQADQARRAQQAQEKAQQAQEKAQRQAQEKAQRQAQDRARDEQRRSEQARRAQEDQQRRAAEQRQQVQNEREARRNKKK